MMTIGSLRDCGSPCSQVSALPGQVWRLLIPGGRRAGWAGAIGQVQKRSDQEYGPQDFYGVIDELRIWRSVRTQAEILAVRTSFLCSVVPGSPFDDCFKKWPLRCLLALKSGLLGGYLFYKVTF